MNTKEMLQAARDFQREHVMTEAEAKALSSENKNRPTIPVRQLPKVNK